MTTHALKEQAAARRFLIPKAPVLVMDGRRSLGVWDEASAHLATAENVRVALAYVARGEAPLGIVYRTDALIEPAVKIVGIFPAGSHPPIVYPAALVKGAQPGAAAFLKFLSSDKARAVFEKAGFSVLR